MPAPPASTLTPREQAVADFFREPRVADISMAVFAAILGVVARGFAQAYCSTAPTGPIPGSDGASYCATVSHGWSWVAYAAVATGLACSVRIIASRALHSRRMALLAVTVVGVAATVWVWSLPTGIGAL